MEENKYQLKNELRKYKQEKEKDGSSILKQIPNKAKNYFEICNKQTILLESKTKNSLIKSNNINIEKDKRERNETYVELNKRIGELIKKNEDLSKANNKLENKKNELIQQVNSLNDLIDLSNKDLVNKILELQKVNEVLNKELNIESDKKYILENKIKTLEKNINRQIDEVSERDEMSIRKESQKESIENNKEINKFVINEENNDKMQTLKNQIIMLKNENYSLMKTINNLKNEIRKYQMKLNPSKKGKDSKEKILKDDEDLIKNITDEMNRWKKEYYNLSKVNDILKAKLTKLEQNLGVEEEIKYLKEILNEKDKLLMDLTLQIKEYQSESDDIILGKTNKKKEKQLEILLKEVKGVRKRLLNMVTFNDRINNFDDFINNIEIIQNLENKIKDKEAKKAFEQLKLFIDEYKLNNDMAYNEFLVKLYSV